MATAENRIAISAHINHHAAPYDNPLSIIETNLFQNEQAIQYALSLDILHGVDLESLLNNFEPRQFHEIRHRDSGIRRVVLDPEDPDIGLILTKMDLATNFRGQPKRLQLDENGDPIYWQMGSEAILGAVASRIHEFNLFHNPHVYTMLRRMINGEAPDTPRHHVRSPAIETLLQFQQQLINGKQIPSEQMQEVWDDIPIVNGSAAFSELGYTRCYTEHQAMSRSKASNEGLFMMASGIPTSFFGLGGMPTVTGWADVLATTALSFSDVYISHNSYFAGGIELQLRLFEKAKQKIHSLNLPHDIEQLVIQHIGISVGSENPEAIAQDVKKYTDAGGALVRIYTTNTDYRVPETAERIRDSVGNAIRLCVGPIVDIPQARALVKPAIQANILLAGHGGGENCTSLEGGGTHNALELLYIMSQMSEFDHTAIGPEGGTGTTFGAILDRIDVISLNRRGVAAGIECGGGLGVQHVKGFICQPYHGTASAVTQRIEAALYPHIAKKRQDSAGRLKNVEGKPNYMIKPRHIQSIVDAFHEARMLAGRTLADQGAISINDLRAKINQAKQITHHRIVSPKSFETAQAHTST